MRSNEPAGSPVVFVFFDAWTLTTERCPGMVRRILEEGFSLLDFEFRTLSEADAEEIYRTNHPIRESNSWHVARLVYPMGRSLGLLFATRDPASCACVRMQRLKGKANPCLNAAGQLRHDFLAPNRCLSLMHSSDSLEQVYREARVFFSTEAVATALSTARTGSDVSDQLLDELLNGRAESGIEHITEPGLTALFARVRLRLIKELERVRPDLVRAPSLESYRKLWLAASRETSRRPVIAEACSYLQMVCDERPLLAAITGAVGGAPADLYFHAEYYRPSTVQPESLLSCLHVLSQPESYSCWDACRQLPPDALHDRWERLLFRTHLFNFEDLLASGATPT